MIECIEAFYQNKGTLQKIQQKSDKLMQFCNAKLKKEEKKLEKLTILSLCLQSE